MVDAGHRWITECPTPIGKLVFDHVVDPVAGGRVRVVKKVDVQGALAPVIRLLVPKMRRDIAEFLANLGKAGVLVSRAGSATGLNGMLALAATPA